MQEKADLASIFEYVAPLLSIKELSALKETDQTTRLLAIRYLSSLPKPSLFNSFGSEPLRAAGLFVQRLATTALPQEAGFERFSKKDLKKPFQELSFKLSSFLFFSSEESFSRRWRGGSLSPKKPLSEKGGLLLALKPERLPQTLERFSGLTRLRLSGLCLEELPPEIGKLSCLESFWIQGNRLKRLPEELGDLSRLFQLNARENELTALPKRFDRLKALWILDISCNRFDSLPEEVYRLASLRLLAFSHEGKIAFSKERLSQMPSLCHFTCSL